MKSPERLPSLERTLLFNLVILVAAIVNLALLAAAALVVLALPTLYGVSALVLLIAADLIVLVLVGRHLIRKLVLRPVATLMDAADELAAGNLSHRAPHAETREFTLVAEGFNRMIERLSDTQDQLVRAEKLASIGYLAAGVAHEVGNPLSAIGNYLDVLESRGADPVIVAALNRETRRIDKIVRGLLEYARAGPEDAEQLALGEIMSRVVELLTDQGALKHINLKLEVEQALPTIEGKLHALEQVMVNLILNAADAAPSGSIVVGASRQQYRTRPNGERRKTDESVFTGPKLFLGRRPWRPEVADGTDGVMLWVADSGTGVPGSERERIFDPFFTTKEPGKGTGLGLAIVQSAVDELGGVVWVDEAREGGAAFKIFLPEAA